MTDARDYGVSARDYLARARLNLASDQLPSLFYAAFELRCCVEARQDLYLEAQRKYRRSLPRSWQLKPKSRELDRIFASNRIAKITVHFDDSIASTFHYVPVSTSLLKAAQKLGDDLHCKQRHHDPSHPWWSELRDRLVDTYRQAWFCCKGQLLCPLLLNPDLKTEGIFDMDGLDPDFITAMRSGRDVKITVAYPTTYPSDWICNL